MIVLLYILPALLLLYLLAVMPSLGKKEALKGFNTVYFAHRGLHDTPTGEGVAVEQGSAVAAPENSLTAIERAVAAGYGIELDVQLTRDGQVIVFHDETLDRVCGVPGRLLDFDYEELCEFRLYGTTEGIPLFSDVLALVAGRVPLIVELKIVGNDVAVCAKCDELLRAYDGVYCVESFHPFALRWYRQNHPAVIRGQLGDRFTKNTKYRHPKYWLLQNLFFNILTRPDFIAFQHEERAMWSRSICRLFGNLAVAWTIYTNEELEEARRHFDWFIFEGFCP